MKNYIEMKAAGAAGVRFKKYIGNLQPKGARYIEHWRHVYSDIHGQRGEDRVSDPLYLLELEDDIERLQAEVSAKEDRIKNLQAMASDIKELEASAAYDRTAKSITG